MTSQQVENTYKRKSDKNDYYIVGNTHHEIQHYRVNDKFRIHGIILEGQFHVLKLDPNHKVHD